jgi:hypothetical protein
LKRAACWSSTFRACCTGDTHRISLSLSLSLSLPLAISLCSFFTSPFCPLLTPHSKSHMHGPPEKMAPDKDNTTGEEGERERGREREREKPAPVQQALKAELHRGLHPCNKLFGWGLFLPRRIVRLRCQLSLPQTLARCRPGPAITAAQKTQTWRSAPLKADVGSTLVLFARRVKQLSGSTNNCAGFVLTPTGTASRSIA